MIAQTTEQTARFIYTSNPKTARTVTVAFVYDDASNSIRVSHAECSKRDRFVKRIGRDVAFGRLVANGGKTIGYDVMGGSSYKNIVKYVVENIDSIIK